MTLRETDPTAWLVAREDIRQLVSRYAVAFGRGDYRAIADLFVPDVAAGRGRTGREAFAVNIASMMTNIDMAILHVTNHVIGVDDLESATGVVGTRAELAIDGNLVVQMIEYSDVYRCVDGTWLFEQRDHQLWYGAPVGANPLTLPPANWPASPTGMGTLPRSL